MLSASEIGQTLAPFSSCWLTVPNWAEDQDFSLLKYAESQFDTFVCAV